jgi:hypothetical protein
MLDDEPAEFAILQSIHHAIKTSGVGAEQLASHAGVSTSYLRSVLAGRKALAPSRLVAVCRALHLDFAVVSKALDQAVGGTTHLRFSHAGQLYRCSYCDLTIRPSHEYVRLEPSGMSRQRGVPVRHFCRKCALQAGWVVPGPIEEAEKSQLKLPFESPIKPTIVQLVDVSALLAQRVFADPKELFNLDPAQFEEFVLGRLIAMGLRAHPVGPTNRRDGGIDIIFTPQGNFPFPFVGAVQVKHRRDPKSKIGPEPVRELMGVVATNRHFAAGMVVTNTSFTIDALEFAAKSPAILRLRGFEDMKRWVANNFTDDAEWREIPKRIELCKGVFVNLA